MKKYTPLRALRPRITDEVICVRISRLWYYRGGTDQGPIKEIQMVILDSQGDNFHAIVPRGIFEAFIDILHEKNVYEINGFLLVARREVTRPVDTPFAIVFRHLTTLQRRDDFMDTLPRWAYSLTSLSCLPPPTMDPGCLIDVLGIICGISDIQSFRVSNRKTALIKRHVYLRDLRGHEIKIVLWGNCALRFNGNIIRSLGQTEKAIAIFVGTTIQEYDGNRGLAGGAACSWYINEAIIDIELFRSSLGEAFQPIAHSPPPHLLSLRGQVGENWPRKHVAQLAAFNLFENKDARFQCTVKISRIPSRQQWWYTGCKSCHRMARPADSAFADPRTYTCSDMFCSSVAADVVYCLSVIGSDQTGEAEFTLFGKLAEEVIGSHIHLMIANNQPTEDTVINVDVAARKVRFPPPEITKILSGRYSFVVSVSPESFLKSQASFMVRKVEAAFPRVRPFSSLDTVIPPAS